MAESTEEYQSLVKPDFRHWRWPDAQAGSPDVQTPALLSPTERARSVRFSFYDPDQTL